MKVSAHLTFAGQCREAFEFYERCFNGTVQLMQAYRDSPMAAYVPENWRDKILHASLIVDRDVLLGADVQPEKYKKPAGMFVMLDVSDAAEAARIFAELSEGGNVMMPLQATHWAAAFGIVTDRFGTPWEINCATQEGDGIRSAAAHEDRFLS
jgi:PhnB protein